MQGSWVGNLDGLHVGQFVARFCFGEKHSLRQVYIMVVSGCHSLVDYQVVVLRLLFQEGGGNGGKIDVMRLNAFRESSLTI
jgi:hypothetical protein